MSLLKRENGIGYSKGAVWDTAIEPATEDGLIIKEHTPPVNAREVFVNDNEFDKSLPTLQQIGNYEPAEGNFMAPFYYEGLEGWLASVFGKYSGSALTDGNQHNFEFDPVIEGIFHTLAWDEGDEVKAIPSAVVKGMAMSYDGGFDLTFDYLGSRSSIAGAFTTPLGLTYKTTGVDKFKLLQGTVWLNDHDGSDFADGDKLCVNNIEMSIVRGFEAQPHCAGNSSILEPKEVTPPTFEITLSFPKKDAANKEYHGDFSAGTQKKLKIEFLGPLINATDRYTFTLFVPLMVIMEAPEYDQESPIPTTVKLQMLAAAAAPTGMTKIIPYAELINEIDILTGYPAI